MSLELWWSFSRKSPIKSKTGDLLFRDLENNQVSGLITQVNKKSDGIQMEIDEVRSCSHFQMQEIFMEIEKLNNLSMIERAQQSRLKNVLNDL